MLTTDELRLNVEYVDPISLKAYQNNAKLHPREQIEQIKESIKLFGFRDPIGLWHGEIVEGHGRQIAAIELGLSEVPVIRLDDLTDEQRRAYALIHNQTTMSSGFDFGILDIELDNISDIDMSAFGFDIDLEGDEYESTAAEATERKGNLKERYLVPPFSVIYGNKPDWLARKRDWVNAGLRSDIGRGGILLALLTPLNGTRSTICGGHNGNAI